MKCLECKSLDLQTHPRHAQVGFGKCKHEKLPGVLMSFAVERECKMAERAADDIVSKRVDWYKKESEKWAAK